MFDHVAPNVFWPLLLLGSFVAATLVTWLFAKLVDGANPKKRRFQQRDHVAERRRTVERNGFKSRIGAR